MRGLKSTNVARCLEPTNGRWRRFVAGWLVFGLCHLGCCSVSHAQGEWISRIDDDRNGIIEPDEISDRARRYLEEFARPYGLRLTRPQPVRTLEEAARRYYARGDRDEESGPMLKAPAETIRGFGSDAEEPMLPGFGAGEIRFPYTASELESAQGLIDRYDQDDDGVIDAEEAREVRWRGASPTMFDFDRNGELSVTELAQRYAQRRIAERVARLSIAQEPGGSEQDPGRSDRRGGRDWWSRGRAGSSRGGDRGAESLAESILERFDFNRNGQLDAEEMGAVGLPIAAMDYDRNGGVSDRELAQYLFVTMEKQADQMLEQLPTWFFERDADGDSQIVMAEFTEEWTEEKLAEFNGFDGNQDGIITAGEVLSSRTVAGGRFRNSQAQVLLPRSTTTSEIEVDEDFLIGDLDVQLGISHTYVSQLDGYLEGPDGERIELFTGVGGSDDHFKDTIFNDEAGNNIARARPPFEGEYQPEEKLKRQPGLSRYHGKNLKGVWKLIIRGSRSERSGLLHGWSLIVKPATEQVERLASERAEEAAAAAEGAVDTERTDNRSSGERGDWGQRSRSRG